MPTPLHRPVPSLPETPDERLAADQRIREMGTTPWMLKYRARDPYERKHGLCRWRCSPLSPRRAK